MRYIGILSLHYPHTSGSCRRCRVMLGFSQDHHARWPAPWPAGEQGLFIATALLIT